MTTREIIDSGTIEGEWRPATGPYAVRGEEERYDTELTVFTLPEHYGDHRFVQHLTVLNIRYGPTERPFVSWRGGLSQDGNAGAVQRTMDRLAAAR